MSKGNLDKISFIKPCVAEFPRKGYRELYLIDDTWGSAVFLLLGANDEVVKQWSTERFGEPLDGSKHQHAFAGYVKFSKSSVHYIILRDKWTWHRTQWQTLVHELHHVTTDILNGKGVNHSGATEEAWAYLQDSLLGKFIWAISHRSKVLQRPKKRPLARKRRRK